jgi:uncharacterized membrane protein YbaN (DUF454 family)
VTSDDREGLDPALLPQRSQAAALHTRDEASPRGWGGRRLMYFALGWSFFGLGVLGAILPVLPTTPFMLLAAWGFSRSSPRFERWLLEHRWFGPSIVRWRAHRVVPLRVKLVSYATMLVTFSLSLASGRLSWWALVGQAALMAYGAWFLARLPSKIPRQ